MARLPALQQPHGPRLRLAHHRYPEESQEARCPQRRAKMERSFGGKVFQAPLGVTVWMSVCSSFERPALILSQTRILPRQTWRRQTQIRASRALGDAGAVCLMEQGRCPLVQGRVQRQVEMGYGG